MPWIARCENIPKLKGGFYYDKNKYYIVTKASDKNVRVIEIQNRNNTTTVTKDQARIIFDVPKWISDEKLKDIFLNGQ
jgi:hypothetical protein